MATSQNGWPVLTSDSHSLVTWVIPTKQGPVRVRLRNGSAGFILAHFALWWADKVEPILGKILDDWGWAPRPIRGSTEISNHASGTALDINATRWPLGTTNMPRSMVARIRIRIHLWLYRGALRWGGDYHYRKDQMHTEIDVKLAKAERVARRLMRTARGKRILKANPGQRRVILS